VVYSWFAMNRDEKVAKNADMFDPERYLDENSQFKRELSASHLFGLGKRRCPGESLARAEVT